MLDLAGGEELTQGAVVGVTPGVVAHQPLRGDALCLEPLQCPGDEPRDGLSALVAVQLDVAQARVIIDDRMREVITHPCALIHPVAVALRTVSRDAMPWPLKARIAGRVYVQQITGARPLVSASEIPWLTRTA